MDIVRNGANQFYVNSTGYNKGTVTTRTVFDVDNVTPIGVQLITNRNLGVGPITLKISTTQDGDNGNSLFTTYAALAAWVDYAVFKSGNSSSGPVTYKETAVRIANAARTPITLVQMATPPTIAVSLTNTVTGISGGIFQAANAPGVGPLSYIGADFAVTQTPTVTNWINAQINMYSAASVLKASGLRQGGTGRVRFGYAGPSLELNISAFQSGVTKAYRIWVNGQVTDVIPRNDLDGTTKFQRIKIDFGTAAPRVIDFEMDQAIRFGGVTRMPDYNIYPIPETGLRIVALLDSYGEGTGADFYMSGFAQQMFKRLGVYDAYNAGEGGLGYLKAGTASGKTGLEKLDTDVIPYKPHLIIVGLGINDKNATNYSTLLGPQVDAFYKKIFKALPNALVVAIGPFTAPALITPDDVFATIKSTISAQVQFNKQLKYVDTKADNWQQNAGRIGAVSGSGNSNVYIGADNAHPAQIGHDYLGQIAAAAVLNAIKIQ